MNYHNKNSIYYLIYDYNIKINNVVDIYLYICKNYYVYDIKDIFDVLITYYKVYIKDVELTLLIDFNINIKNEISKIKYIYYERCDFINHYGKTN